MGKSTLILVLGAVSLFAIANLNVNNSIFESGKLSFGYFNKVNARNVANSMIQILLSELADDFEYRVDSSSSLLGGFAEYSITDLTGADSMFVKIEVTAKYPDPEDDWGPELYETQNTVAYAAPGGGWVPPFVRGAWTANSNLNNTISDMYIDGRNHKVSDLSIKPNTGRPGVSTSVEFVNTQNAEIGGTSWAGVDYPMTYPEDHAIIEDNYNWGGVFPTTPDAILGYPEGTLKTIAKSKAYGSQYLVNPPMITIGKKKNVIGGLTYPISGVTYIRIDNGNEYEFFFQGTGNKGMLVIHGPNRDARIVGVKYDTGDGLFTGLMVTDYSFHHHVDILGAVLQLSPNLETSKDCNGNKDHWVYYSSEAIEDATRITSEVSNLLGNNDNFSGFGSSRIPVSRIYE